MIQGVGVGSGQVAPDGIERWTQDPFQPKSKEKTIEEDDQRTSGRLEGSLVSCRKSTVAGMGLRDAVPSVTRRQGNSRD